MFCLKSSLILVIIALKANNIFCDINESVDQNKSHAFNTSNPMIGSGHKSNVTDFLSASKIGDIRITNGFLLRTLFVVMVIVMSLFIICMIRVFSSRRWKSSKASKEWTHPKYDSLPTAAINDSIKKNAFVLNDSEDEEFTIFDANQRLIVK